MRFSVSIMVLLFSLSLFTPAFAHEKHHQTGHNNTTRTVDILHFSHPLIGESPTPDQKIRINGEFLNKPGGEQYTTSLDLEYLLTPGMSLEVGIPYTFRDPDAGSDVDDLGNSSLELKIANPWFSKRNLQLIHGFGIGLPTGDDDKGIGSNNIVEYEGVLGFGYKPRPGWQLTGFAELGVPTNQGPNEPIETEVGWNLALLKNVNASFQALLELDGETVLSAEESEEDGRDVIHLSPGFKYRIDMPTGHHSSHWVGVSAGFPVSGAEAFDSRLKFSYFWHF